VIQGGAPTFYRTVIAATFTVSDDDGDNPGWHTICAPLGPLLADNSLPVPTTPEQNANWVIASSPCDYTAGINCVGTITGTPTNEDAWCPLWSDVHAIGLPIDPTGNPAVCVIKVSVSVWLICVLECH
jgi:hypothetical protein